MILLAITCGKVWSCKPRASGDDPFDEDTGSRDRTVNPARAGMIPG